MNRLSPSATNMLTKGSSSDCESIIYLSGAYIYIGPFTLQRKKKNRSGEPFDKNMERPDIVYGSGPSFFLKCKYLLLTEFEVRTVSYGPSFFPLIYGPRASRLGHKSTGKSEDP